MTTGMDGHDILEYVFLTAFWAGLVFSIVSAVMSGAFHHEFGQGSSFEGGHAGDLGGPHIEGVQGGGGHHGAGQAHVGWSDSNFPGASPMSPTVLAAAVTGFGAFGYMAIHHWNFGNTAAFGIGLAGSLLMGGATFGFMFWLFRTLQGSSHVVAQALVGTKALVFTAIESGQAGAITIEAQGTRMTVPARAADAAQIPIGAEIEIQRESGGVYIVAETRESWLARSKASPGRWT